MVIGIRKSKDREHNDQTIRDKRINNDPQNTQKAKDRTMRIKLITGSELGCFVMVNTDIRPVILVTHAKINHQLRPGSASDKRGIYMVSCDTYIQ